MTGRTPNPNRNPIAGGAPLALSIIAGPFVAGWLGYSPSIGFVAGLGIGIVIALLIWFAGRR